MTAVWKNENIDIMQIIYYSFNVCVAVVCTLCLLNSSYVWFLHKCTPQQAVALTIF